MEAWIPLLEAMVWPVMLVGVIIAFRKPLARFVGSVTTRVESGADLELSGPAGVSAKLTRFRQLESADAAETASAGDGGVPDWTRERKTIYTENRFVFLSHMIAPSSVRGQRYEVFAFLVGHRRDEKGYPTDLSDVTKAEFFLGGGWRNRVFTVEHGPGRDLGLRAHSYAPYLCICRVHFQDGKTAVLHRYMDFAMAGLVRPEPGSGD